MVLEFFDTMPYGDAVLAAIIIAVSVVAAKIFMIIFEKVFLHVSKKTRTTLDDAILSAVRKPMYFGIILVGIFFAVDSLNYAGTYLAEIRQAFTVLWILLGAYTATRVVKVLFAWYTENVAKKTGSKIDDTIAPILRKILSMFVYAIALMIILRSFGVEITPLVAGLGIGGLAIALALQDTLSNLFSGAFIVSDKAMKVGDYIEIEGGVKGYIEEIGWRSTRIRTLPNNLVIVPNSKIANSVLTNYNDPSPDMAVLVEVGVAYGSDLDKVEQVTVDVAKEVLQKTQGAVKDFAPFIRYHTFADSNINFTVILRGQTFVDQYLLKHEFIKTLKRRYDKEGIEISWPVRKVVQS